MRSSLPTWTSVPNNAHHPAGMPKRKRVESGAPVTQKKARQDEDQLEKFLSLAASESTLTAGLTYFLTTVQQDDEGVRLVEQYLERSPGCEHVLAPLGWERDRRTYDVILLCFCCLEQILLHTASSSSDTQYSSKLGHKLVLTILRDHMRPVYSSLVSIAPDKLTASCLRLLAAMVAQGPASAREVQLVFNFGYKPVGLLPNKTSKIPGSDDSLRQCFIKFALSFLIVGDSETITAVLELRGFLSALFKLLPMDSPDIVHLILSTLLHKVILDPGVSKKTKSGFFNQFVLKQTAQLLSRKSEESPTLEEDGVAMETMGLREFVLEFLLRLCTDFQNGICYRSKDGPAGLERTNNPVLLHLLLSLTPSLPDPLVQELAIRIMEASPNLLLPYLRSLPLSFDPRPSVKWINNMKFITKLFSALPPITQLLGDGVSVEHHPPPSHFSVYVGFTVPMVTTRLILNQGIQTPIPLVKYHTLGLIVLILRRATTVVECLGEKDRMAGDESFPVLYCDSVLKLLPDVKTLITARQLGGGGGAVRSKVNEGTLTQLTAEQRLKNAELTEDSSLLALALAAMQGYQRLSPSIFAQVDFNVAQLLFPPPSGFHDNQESHNPQVMLPTLQLLLDAPAESLKWQQKGSIALPTLLWLGLSDSEVVSRTANKLLLKLLLSNEALGEYQLELEVLLTTLRHCHTAFSLSHEDTLELVAAVASVLLAAARDPCGQVERMEAVLAELQEEGDSPVVGREWMEGRKFSLQEILEAPLEMPVAMDTEVTGKHTKKKNLDSGLCPLVPCLLTKLEEESGVFLVFVGGVLTRLVVTQQDCEVCATIVLHHLTARETREKLQASQWRGLYCSLVEYFSSWVHHPPTVESYSEESVSARKAQKKLRKMANSTVSAEILPLLFSLEREVIVECLPTIWKSELLRSVLVSCAQMRPLALAGGLDNPQIAKVLKSLPFTSILSQTIVSQIDPPDLFTPAISSLVGSLCSAELRELLRERLRKTVEGGDLVELGCSVRAMLVLLWKVYSSRKGCTLSGSERSAVEFSFELLASCVACSSSGSLPEGDRLSLASTVFDSTVFRWAFTDGTSLATTAAGTGVSDVKLSEGKPRKQKKKTNVFADVPEFDCSMFFCQQIGSLMCQAVEAFPPLKSTAQFEDFVEELFVRFEGCVCGRENEKQGVLVADLLRKFLPHVARQRQLMFCERLLSSIPLGEETPVDRTHPLARVLQTVLVPEDCRKHLSSLDEDRELDFNMLPKLRDSTAAKLIEVAVRSNLEEMDCVLFAVVARQVQYTHNTGPAPSARRPPSAVEPQDSSLMTTVRSLLKPLLPTEDKESSELERERTRSSVGPASLVTDSLCHKVPAALAEDLTKLLRTLQSKAPMNGLSVSTLTSNRTTCLSGEHVAKLLDYCLASPTVVRVKIVSLLLRAFDTAVDRVLQLLSDVESESELHTLHLWLYLVKEYLGVAERRQGEGEVSDWKGGMKVVRKKLWEKCSLLLADDHCPPGLQATCSSVVQLLCSLSSKARKHFKRLADSWRDSPTWNRHQLSLTTEVACCHGDLNLGHMAVGRLFRLLMVSLEKEEGEEEGQWVVEQVNRIIQEVPGLSSVGFDLTSEEWNSFLRSALRWRFTQPAVIHVLTSLLRLVWSSSDDSPGGCVPLETVYEMVWSHSEFLEVMCSSHDPATATTLAATKESLVGLLVAIVELQPSICRTSHFATLLSAYSATRNNTDRGLLYLMLLYERAGTAAGEYRPFLWGPAALEQYKIKQEMGWLLWKQPDTQEVVEQLDRGMLLQSTENFPLGVPLEPTNPFAEGRPGGSNSNAAELYDPCFLLPLLSHLLDPGCLVDCRHFVSRGCLGYLLSSLSSLHETTRSAGCHALSRFLTHLEGARFREKQQIVMILEVVKNSLTEKNDRLPSIFTAFASKAAHLFLHPESSVYPVVAHFTVYRPVLDLREIPLFYMLLHSSSPQHSHECAWLLKLLLDGLRCEEDYPVYRRKKALSQTMGLCGSTFVDNKCQSLIFQLVCQSCSIPLVAADLVWNQGLLAWLQHMATDSRNRDMVLRVVVVLWKSLIGGCHGDKKWRIPPMFEEELALTLDSILSSI